MNMESTHDFERELGLEDLLRGIDGQRLTQTLQGLLEAPMALYSPQGDCPLGAPLPAETPRIAIVIELEPVAELAANTSQPRLKAAADMLTLLLRSNARYLMASDLHIQTQRADFEELQRRHIALAKSEQRYKRLAETLEQRVQQQVKTIEQAQLKLYESEKLASVGRLAAGVAHEINNPIGFIRSNLATASDYQSSLEKIDTLFQNAVDLQTLKTAWQREDMHFLQQDLRDILDESIHGTERIAEIVKDLKGFSRVNDTEQESANLNHIIRQISNITTAELRDKAELVLELAEIPSFKCQPGELGQALLNVLMNSVDAIVEKGIIHVRTRLDNTGIVVEIKDNGCGISASDLPHVFDPFFTTKDVGKGMGLGLSVCRNIIKAHGGDITIKSKPNVGTLVSIHLPYHPLVSSR